MKKVNYAVPLYLVMVIPLIVYGKVVKSGLSGFPWYTDNDTVLDMFLYYKQNAILMISCLIMLFIIVMIVRKEFEGNFQIFLPLFIYVLLNFITMLVSSFKDYALNGAMEQFESVWVIAGYFLICIYAYLAYCKSFFTAFGILCGVEGAIGTLQFLGVDIYRTALFQRLCMPQDLQEITFHITVERGRSYCSMSNPNYAGVLCCLTIPVLTVLIFCAKKWREKLLYIVSDLLMLCSFVGSRSKSGILSLAVCMVLLVFLFRRQIADFLQWSVKKMTAFLVIIMFVAGIIALLVIRQWGDFSDRKYTPDTQISEISTNDKNVKLVYHNKVLFFSIDYDCDSLEEAVNIVDEDGKHYAVSAYQGTLYFDDQALSELTVSLVQYGEYVALEIWDGNYNWYFTDQTKDHTWYFLTHYGKLDKLVSEEIAIYKGLEGMERIASGRGYIWSRTIPLMKEHILFGSGQDSFTVVFSNDDYLGMAQWGYKDMLITKPHCMYMQIAVQSGLLSLGALLCFWICFLVKSISKKTDDIQSILSKAVAVGILGYLLMGVTNDSNIGVAPIFWMLTGIGLCLSENTVNG